MDKAHPIPLLVVEDEPGDFGLIRNLICKAGAEDTTNEYSLTWRKRLSDAIAASKTTDYSVVLLDLSLPDSNGLETVQKMRAAASNAPIVVLTGVDDNALALAALEAGAQDYLIKGRFDHDALGRAIRHARVRSRLELELMRHRQHLEIMVAERTAELASALKASETANRAKNAFLANIGHEVRTPMNGILGLTSLLMQTSSEPTQQRRLAQLDAVARDLLKVFDNILDISAIEAGKVCRDERDFDLSGLLQEVAAATEASIRAKKLTPIYDFDHEFPPRLCGDPVRLKQVLLELIGNALKFTDSGSIALRAKIDTLDSHSMIVIFSTADTGIGIAAQDIQRIFSAFEQADNSPTRAFGGCGLGLAIARHRVESMGGRLEVDSQPGQGSIFSFAIALKRSAAVAPSETRALVADRDPMCREIVTSLLAATHIQTDIAPDGLKATELAMRITYDLILIAAQLPDMDGFAAARAIRTMPHHTATPILMLTDDAFSSAADNSDIFDGQIDIPIDPKQLYSSIDAHLKSSPPKLP